MLSEAKHLAGEWEKSLSVGLRFFAALRMTTTLWFTGVIRIGSKAKNAVFRTENQGLYPKTAVFWAQKRGLNLKSIAPAQKPPLPWVVSAKAKKVKKIFKIF
ncbi:MAG TPA: hypothetical protein VMX13_13865 [Sedimentisphaerales bacterium]|nr:hypothetical protein [Sedimentisphaerales bacterium]